MITTADIVRETGLKQRTVQKRIGMLGITPRRVGPIIVLTEHQAERIKAMDGKPGPKSKGDEK